MAERFVPANELRIGQRVMVRPLREGLPRGARLSNIPAEGMAMTVTDYVHGMAQRGAVHCFEEVLPTRHERIAEIVSITQPTDGEE